MEGDRSNMEIVTEAANFNPLPPHGGRPFYFDFSHGLLYFNPLPPHGGRPFDRGVTSATVSHFNPLPPHGGRLYSLGVFAVDVLISIHSLRMEGDLAAFGVSPARV